jgi:hypothetical protein
MLCEQKEQNKCIEVKGIKRGIKIFGYPYGCVGVYTSVQIKKLNNFNWNERILTRFSGPVQLVQVIFVQGSQISQPSGYGPYPKQPV